MQCSGFETAWLLTIIIILRLTSLFKLSDVFKPFLLRFLCEGRYRTHCHRCFFSYRELDSNDVCVPVLNRTSRSSSGYEPNIEPFFGCTLSTKTYDNWPDTNSSVVHINGSFNQAATLFFGTGNGNIKEVNTNHILPVVLKVRLFFSLMIGPHPW